MGRYLDIARTAATSSFCPGRDYEINEINEISLPTGGKDGAQVAAPRPILRAALIAVPDGVPEVWAQGICDLLVMPPHPAWTKDGWRVLQQDALRFLQDWAAQANRLGWEALDLFGAHPTAPVARLDSKGLVLLLNGCLVVALTEDSAVIKTPLDRSLTFRRHMPPPVERHLIWAL